MGVNLQAKLRLKPFFFAPSRSFSATLAFFSISFPLLSALGWALGIPLLAQFYPTLPAMQPNTIVGLLVMSATLIIFRGKSSTTLQTIVSFFLSSSVILVGLLSFCENIFGWDLGIDKLFTGYIPLLNQTSLVHMALQTSLNFVFLGLGLIFLNIRSFPIYIAQTCAIFVGANALVAATGYIFNLSNLYIYPIVGMAIPTSIAFILLSGSFLCSRPREGLMSLLGGATRSSHMARRILFTCIIVPPLAGLITKVGVLAGWYSSNVQISLSTVFIIGIILRATWVAARQSEKEELRADEAYEKTQKINELLMQAIDERKIFTELIENSSDLIGIFYPNGEPRYLNPAGRKMLGLTPSFPIENATTSEFYTPDQRALAVDTIVKATKENGFWRGETTFRNWTTEEVIPVSQEQFLIRDPESGKDLGMGTITRNMTERKRIEAATLASEQQYKTLVESAYDSILVADANVQIILVNDQLLRKFGYSSEELIGQPLEILVPDRHKKTYSAARHSYAKDLHLHPMGTRFEFYGRRKDGKEFPVEISLSPRALSEGSGITAIIRDNTEKKRHEDQNLFLAETAKDLSDTLDHQERLQRMADAIVPKIADICVVGLLENEELQFKAVAIRDKSKLELLRQIAPSGLASRGPYRSRAAVDSGTPILIEDIKSDPNLKDAFHQPQMERLDMFGITSFVTLPLIVAGKTIGSISLSMTDSGRSFSANDLAFAEVVANRCAVAVNNARLYMEAQKAISARERILAIVSHDLKNPAAVIDMSAQLLLKQEFSKEKVLDAAQRIRNSSVFIQRLIADLLDFGKIEAGEFSVKKEPVLVQCIVDNALELLSTKTREKGVRLSVNIPTGVADVLGDKDRITQVIWNLIGNAIKFTPTAGKISVDIKSDADFITFTVSDTGPGIEAADISKVFDKFWQAEKTATLGTGLGLSIAKGIVEAHGGRIWVESEIGSGTQFHFTIPTSKISAPRMTVSAKIDEKVTSLGEQALKGIHVLLVDDSLDNLHVSRLFLERAGAKITVATSVTEALASVMHDRPNIMITDIEMPGGDGYELIQKIHKMVSMDNIYLPVAVLTGHTDEEALGKISQAGFDDHLSKPITPDKLVSSIQKIMSRDLLH